MVGFGCGLECKEVEETEVVGVELFGSELAPPVFATSLVSDFSGDLDSVSLLSFNADWDFVGDVFASREALDTSLCSFASFVPLISFESFASFVPLISFESFASFGVFEAFESFISFTLFASFFSSLAMFTVKISIYGCWMCKYKYKYKYKWIVYYGGVGGRGIEVVVCGNLKLTLQDVYISRNEC
ncbi:hypothetical protein LELG_00642 [Lodderomyces elongisporus NRRL YB-4239]|uniref:Uncharacterized protein n=1 Tax=Lodderomyces elongisporus (strain ATCC 11503 / CBS 2605 / JCM 1781 / NBRC 1676 / NRRL YB-4239) TaxID=379508 RepID=A5DTF6_LODEL|nr:hypothetical protein LELG_00642 [Lodderomyces elongisporus NRRL YB-4239]